MRVMTLLGTFYVDVALAADSAESNQLMRSRVKDVENIGDQIVKTTINAAAEPSSAAP
jgi:hypothetical protein